MKDVVKVSIAGMAFTFDAKAYEVMNTYISTLERNYGSSTEGREIVADIEARVVELILSRQEADRIVEAELAQEIVEQLGYPDDMPIEEPKSNTLPRRLYRNPEGAKMGGVCSGLATYFNIDPSFLRIGIFLPMILWIVCGALDLDSLSSCFGAMFLMVVLGYFTLLIAVPMAKSPREKLEMRGEKITASSIKQNFRQEATMGQNKSQNSVKAERSASLWAEIVYAVGRIIMFCIKAIMIMFGICLGFAALMLLIVLIFILLGGEMVTLSLMPFAGLVGMSPAAYMALGVLVALILVTIAGFIFISFAAGHHPERRTVTILSAILGISMLFFSIMTVRNLSTLTDPDRWYHIEEFYEQYEDIYDHFEDAIEDGERVTIDMDREDGEVVIHLENHTTGEKATFKFNEEGSTIEEYSHPDNVVWEATELGVKVKEGEKSVISMTEEGVEINDPETGESIVKIDEDGVEINDPETGESVVIDNEGIKINSNN